MKLRIYLLEEKLTDSESKQKESLVTTETKYRKKNSIYDYSSDYDEDEDSLNATCNLSSKYFNPTSYNKEEVNLTLNFNKIKPN